MPRLDLRNAVKEYLDIAHFQEKWANDQRIGAGYFYALTYPSICSFFRRHRSLHEELELKVALIFSWNPTICQVTDERFMQAKRDLVSLRDAAEDLDKTGLLNVDIHEAVNKFWYPVKKATSSRDLTPGVSVTKFLHFSFPHIFPMIDLNTMKSLGGATVNLKWYASFLLDWKDLYRQAKTEFDQISQAVDMPVTRVLDVMLFTPR
jgi:hypothetical protein